MAKEFTGGCLCGAVRYACAGEPAIMGHCHCVDCRKSSGSGHCSHIGAPASAVSMTGKTNAYARPADSGAVVTRHFCPTCGAPVFSTNAASPEMMFLRASSLDEVEVFKPMVRVYASRAPSWDVMDSALPSFAEMPPGGPPKS